MNIKYIGPGFGLGVRWLDKVKPSRNHHFELVFIFWAFYLKIPRTNNQ